MTRQIILDTETTGLSADKGDRLIEIGCIELINRRMTQNRFHQYVNPKRPIDEGAVRVHGITEAFLKDKPVFSDIAESLFLFLQGAELIIHNAPFDMGFLNAEFARIHKKYVPLNQHCTVTDTLVMARREYPGQQNTLDALCRRFGVNNKHRDLHGALIDAALLSEVYLAMTGGQSQLFAADASSDQVKTASTQEKLQRSGKPLSVIFASVDELAAHEKFLANFK
jgi:DNA polymerase-3 subunit epsilon